MMGKLDTFLENLHNEVFHICDQQIKGLSNPGTLPKGYPKNADILTN